MENKRASIKKVLLISLAALVVIGIPALVSATLISSIVSQPTKPSREAALAQFMPKQPQDTQFLDEGYDPKSNCFDKCGYLYRRYSYQDQALLCKNLYSVLHEMGSNFTITSGSTQQPPTEPWCADRINQPKAFTLDLEAPVKLKTGIQERSRRVVHVVVSPETKVLEYQIPQTNEGLTIIR